MKIYKNILLNIIAFFITILLVIVTYSLGFPSSSPSGESNLDGIFKQYFDKILVNSNLSTTDGKVKKSQTLVNQDCGSGKVLQGFDSVGDKICMDLINFSCGNTVSAGGYTYTTKLGPDGKCWTSTNMKHGIMLANGSILPSITNIIEKWCFNNNAISCNTDGALYTWAEAMGFPANCDTTSCTQAEDITKSVCGALGEGWNLPTDLQWTTLTNAGANGWTGNKLSGIVSVLTGDRDPWGDFNDHGVYGFRWTSTQFNNGNSWRRRLQSSTNQVDRGNRDKLNGWPVVCIKN